MICPNCDTQELEPQNWDIQTIRCPKCKKSFDLLEVVRDHLRGWSDAEKVAFWEERLRAEVLRKSVEKEPPHWLWSSRADRLILFPVMYVLRFIVLVPIALGIGIFMCWLAVSCVAGVIWFPIYLLAAGLSGSVLIGVIVASGLDYVVIAVIASAAVVAEQDRIWQTTLKIFGVNVFVLLSIGLWLAGYYWLGGFGPGVWPNN